MVSIMCPPKGRSIRSSQVSPTESAKGKARHPAAVSSTRLMSVRTRNYEKLGSAGLVRAQTCCLTAACAQRPLQFSATGDADSQRAPVRGGRSSTLTRKADGSSLTNSVATVSSISNVPIRSSATQGSKSKRDTRARSRGTSDGQRLLAGVAGQERLPDSSSSRADASQAALRLSDTQALKSTSRKLEISPVPLRTKPSYESSRSGSRLLKIGIETEFYLAALNPVDNRGTLEDFMTVLGQKYNRQVACQHPRMRDSVRPYMYQGPYTEWCLVQEESLQSNWMPWGIELVSPVLRVFPGSSWREDVEATWRFLSKNYDVVGNHLAGTHIHVSFEADYTLTDLKRVAQAVIHFETAFEVLVPRARRENSYIKSNWLDAPGLARKGKSRAESIAAIGAADNVYELLHMLHPLSGETFGPPFDRCFGWNFYSWLQKRTIEFRKPPVCTTSKEALSWAELAISFVLASTKCESPITLQRVPPTVGGLRWFLQKYGTEAGLSEPARLERLWADKDLEVVIEPVPQATALDGGKREVLEATLRGKAEEDKRRIEVLVEKARGRYW